MKKERAIEPIRLPNSSTCTDRIGRTAAAVVAFTRVLTIEPIESSRTAKGGTYH